MGKKRRERLERERRERELVERGLWESPLDYTAFIAISERLKQKACDMDMPYPLRSLLYNTMSTAFNMANVKFTENHMYETLYALACSYWSVLKEQEKFDGSTDMKLLEHGLRHVAEISARKLPPESIFHGKSLIEDAAHMPIVAMKV